MNLGQGGWSWDGLIPFFKKSQTAAAALVQDLFPDPSPFRRRQEPTTDDVTTIPTTFLDFADSALNLTALDVSSLLDAAGVADTIGTASNATEKRSLVEERADSSQGNSGPIKSSYNTWYSDIASSFIHTVINSGIPLNKDPVRSTCVVRFACLLNQPAYRTAETTLESTTLSAL